MKKTFPVNINGKIYYIDEDAYELLLNYLTQLRDTFTGNEGEEIVSDIESRIAEHFDECTASGAQAIVYSDVNNIIETMGRPEDLGEDGTRPDNRQQDEHKDEGNATSSQPQATPAQPTAAPHKRVYRNEQNKIFGGVISGLAIYLNFNTNIMRLLVVLLALFSYLWPCIIIYLIVWMVIPAAKTPRQRLEMYGAPVTVGTVGQTVLSSNTTPPPYYQTKSSNSGISDFVNLILTIFAKFVVGIIGLTGVAFAITALAFLVAIIVGWIMMLVSGDLTILNGMDLDPEQLPTLKIWGVITACFSAIIPAIAIIWAACSFIFKTRGASAAWWITAIILEVIFLIATGVIWNYIQSYESYEYLAAASIPITTLTTSALL